MSIIRNFTPMQIEKLKMYLDSTTTEDVMKKRMDDIAGMLVVPKDAENFPTRAAVLRELSFMMKNKDKIIEVLNHDRYMDNFSKAVKFLEKNPEQQLKKTPGGIFDFVTFTSPSYHNWYGAPSGGYGSGGGGASGTTEAAPLPWENGDPVDAESVSEHTYSVPATGTYSVSGHTHNGTVTVTDTQTGHSETIHAALQDLTRALEAGSYNAAPSNLQQGAALQIEELTLPTPRMDAVTESQVNELIREVEQLMGRTRGER